MLIKVFVLRLGQWIISSNQPSEFSFTEIQYCNLGTNLPFSYSIINFFLFLIFSVSAQTYSSPTPVKRLQTPGQPSLNASVSKSNAAAAPSPPPPLKPRSKKKDCKTTNSKSNKKEKQERSNPKMGTNVNEPSLKDLSHPSLNEQLKAYNTATFKLVKTGKVF